MNMSLPGVLSRVLPRQIVWRAAVKDWPTIGSSRAAGTVTAGWRSEGSRGKRERGRDGRNHWALGGKLVGASLATIAVLAKDEKSQKGRDIELYWGSGSPPCWRVMITLEEKGLHNYKSILLSMSQKEQKTADMMKLNPRGELPIAKHGNLVVNQSHAICDYLEYVYSDQGCRLHPTDPAQRALVLQRQKEVEDAQAHITRGLLPYMWSNKPEDRKPGEFQAKKDEFHKEISLWENYLKQQGGKPYIAGQSFSMADAAFFPVLAFFVRMGLRLAPRYPYLQDYYDRLLTRPSIQATWPPHWRGSPRGTLLEDI